MNVVNEFRRFLSRTNESTATRSHPGVLASFVGTKEGLASSSEEGGLQVDFVQVPSMRFSWLSLGLPDRQGMYAYRGLQHATFL